MPLVSLVMQFFLLPMRKIALVAGAGMAVVCAHDRPESPHQSSAEFEAYAKKLREAAITATEPPVSQPTTARTVHSAFKWKKDIVTTVFHVGGKNGESSSAWDPRWREHFGGDDPMD